MTRRRYVFMSTVTGSASSTIARLASFRLIAQPFELLSIAGLLVS
jgi:hypothetical protein